MLQWIRNRYWVIVIYFLVQKSAIFAYVWSHFPSHRLFLVSFYTLDFYFPQAI